MIITNLQFDEVVDNSSRSRFIDRAIDAWVGANKRELADVGSLISREFEDPTPYHMVTEKSP